MAGKSYLVIFEQMVDLFSNNNNPIVPIESKKSRTDINRNALYFVGDDATEKFRGTWWQVRIPYNRSESPEFQYVADSLRDALRLKPELDISYWSCSAKSTHDFVDSTNDWLDEPDEMELLVLD